MVTKVTESSDHYTSLGVLHEANWKDEPDIHKLWSLKSTPWQQNPQQTGKLNPRCAKNLNSEERRGNGA
jgi:hypothetical protein